MTSSLDTQFHEIKKYFIIYKFKYWYDKYLPHNANGKEMFAKYHYNFSNIIRNTTFTLSSAGTVFYILSYIDGPRTKRIKTFIMVVHP